MQLDAMISSWRQACVADFPDSLVPLSEISDFLSSLFGPVLLTDDKPEELGLPRDIVHRVLSQLREERMVDGIPEPVHDLGNLHHVLLETRPIVEVCPPPRGPPLPVLLSSPPQHRIPCLSSACPSPPCLHSCLCLYFSVSLCLCLCLSLCLSLSLSLSLFPSSEPWSSHHRRRRASRKGLTQSLPPTRMHAIPLKSLPQVLKIAAQGSDSSPEDLAINVHAVRMATLNEMDAPITWARPLLSKDIVLMWTVVSLQNSGHSLAVSKAVVRSDVVADQNDDDDVRGLPCAGRATLAPTTPKDVAIREHLMAMLTGTAGGTDLVLQLKAQATSLKSALFETEKDREEAEALEAAKDDETGAGTDADDAMSVAGMSVAATSVAGKSMVSRATTKRRAKGRVAAPKKPVLVLAEARIDLMDFLSGRQSDMKGEWVDLLSCAGTNVGSPVARAQVSISAVQALRTMHRNLKRAYLDSFKVFTFGGLSATSSGPGPGERQTPPSSASTTATAWNTQLCGDLRVFDGASSTWRTLPASMSTPSARWGATMVRHEKRVLLFGGTDGSAVFDDLYELDSSTLTWRNVGSEGVGGYPPLARHSHVSCMVETPGALGGHSSAMLIFGGASDRGLLLGDVAMLAMVPTGSPASPYSMKWLEVAVRKQEGAPLPRCGPAAAVVFSEHMWTLYVFGGRVDPLGSRASVDPDFKASAAGLMNDLWVLKPAAEAPASASAEPLSATTPPELVWRRVETSGRPPPRREAGQMVAVGKKLLLMGGWVGGRPTAGSPWARDMWLLDTNTLVWTSISFYGHSPSGRFGHTALLADFRGSVGELATLRPAAGPSGAGHATYVKDSKGRERLVLKAKAGETVDLVLEARDSLGLRADRGGDLFRVTLEPAPGMDARLPCFYPAIHDRGNSTYSMKVNASAAGNYHLMVRSQEGLLVKSGPVLVLVDAGPGVASRTAVEGDGIRRAPMGERSCFFVIKRDVFGNIVPPPIDDDGLWNQAEEDLAVRIVGPDKQEVPVKTSPDGAFYMVTWAPTLAGRYSIYAKVKNALIPNAPFKLVVPPGPAHIPHCRLSGRLVEARRWHAGAPVKLKLQTMDAFGNLRNRGGDKWTVKMEKMEVYEEEGISKRTGRQFGVDDFEMRDNKDGSYTISFTPFESGTCSLSVLSMNEGNLGAHVEGSPLEFSIKYGALDCGNCKVEGNGLVGRRIGKRDRAVEAGEEQEFTIFAYDMYRNAVSAAVPALSWSSVK